MTAAPTIVCGVSATTTSADLDEMLAPGALAAVSALHRCGLCAADLAGFWRSARPGAQRGVVHAGVPARCD